MAQLLVVKTAELASYEAIKWRLVTCDEVDQGGELRGETLKIIGDRTLLLAEAGTIAPPPPYKVVRNSHKGRQNDVEFALVVTQTNQWGENTYYRGGKPRKNRKTSSGSSDDDDDDDDEDEDDEGGVTALIENGVTALIKGGVSLMMGSDESKSDSGAICVGEDRDADDGTVESVGDADGVTSSHSYHRTFSYGDSTSGHTEVAISSHTEVASSSHTEVASSHTEVASSSHTEVTTSSYSENTTSSYSGGYSSYSGGGGGGDYSGGGDSGGGGGGDCGGGDD